MRDTRQATSENTPSRTIRSFPFPLVLALCACCCLTTASAVAGPPRASDSKFLWDTIGDDSAPRGKCPVAVGGYKVVIRRDSFQAVYMDYASKNAGAGGKGTRVSDCPRAKP